MLTINLSSKKFEIGSADTQIYEKYLGAKGLAAKLMMEINAAGVDPTGRQQHLGHGAPMPPRTQSTSVSSGRRIAKKRSCRDRTGLRDSL
jgi:aldehyde:ferredoxin oxidoreductase